MQDFTFEDIMPGEGAASFRIGDNLANVLSRINVVSEWRETPEGVSQLPENSSDWIKIGAEFLHPMFGARTQLISGPGVVALFFDENDALFKISVGEGYAGLGPKGVFVGMGAEKAIDLLALEYDDVEEMYFPSGIEGMAITIDDRKGIEHHQSLVASISVYSGYFN